MPSVGQLVGGVGVGGGGEEEVLRSFAQWSRASLAMLSKTSGEMNGLERIRGEFGWSLEGRLLVLWK